MFKFKEMIEANMEELAHTLSSEHGKVIADAKGDIQRGLGRVNGFLEVRGGAEADVGLDLALVGIEHIALPLARGEGGTGDEMVDAAKHVTRPRFAGLGLALP
jgi:hypothetical protein